MVLDPATTGALTAAATALGPMLKWLADSEAAKAVATGPLGNWAHQLAELVRKKGWALIVGRLTSDRLPANHDIAIASRASLGCALQWMAHQLHGEPPSALRGDILRRLERGELAGDIEQLAVPAEYTRWLKALLKLARDDTRLRHLECRQLDGIEVERLLQSQTDQDLAAELHQRVGDWIALNLAGKGTAPDTLEDFLSRGWPLEGGQGRLTLYQAWCWFFREHVKQESRVFNSFVATALADMLPRQSLPPTDVPLDFADSFAAHLERPLGDLLTIARATLATTQRIDETTLETQRTVKELKLGFETAVEMMKVQERSDRSHMAPALAIESEVLDDAQHALLAVLVAEDGGPVIVTNLIQSVINSQVNGVRGYLLHSYAVACRRQGVAAWLDGGETRLDLDFIALPLLVRPEVDGSPPERFHSLGNMLEQHAAVQAWVLVGDSGSGKTTLLRHHEMLSAKHLLKHLSRNELGAGDGGELCVSMRLSAYRRQLFRNELHWPDCEDWIGEQWARCAPPGALPAWEVMRRHFRLRFLFDGINEIEAGADPAVRHQAMQQFAAWAGKHRNMQPAPVFTVRRQDRGVAMFESADLSVREAELMRLSPEHIERFCRQGRPAYRELWKRLTSDASQLSLCQIPFNLTAQCALLDQGYVARTRAELFLGMVWLSLKRVLNDMVHSDLLSIRDRNNIVHRRYWKAEKTRHNLPVEGTLVRGLERLAREMAPKLEVAYDEAAKFSSWPGFDRSAWLAAVQSLGMIEARTDETSDVLAFAHQLWQEFFLARALTASPTGFGELAALRPKAGSAVKAPDASPNPPPVPDIVNWEETVRLTVQLAARPEEFVEQLMQTDIALAGRSAAACLERLDDDVKSRLRLTLLERSRDGRLPLPARIDAAEAIGFMGDDIRYKWGGGHGTASAKHGLPRHGSLRGGHVTGWVRVPSGVYEMGRRIGDSDVEQIDCGVGGEPLLIEVAPFELAFAPVTNAEYALFVQDGGYENERWWQGDLAVRWRRGELRDDAGRDWQLRRHAALVENFEDAMAKFFFSSTVTNLEFARFLRGLSVDQAQAYVDSCYPFSGKPPAFMDIADFANPLQPVVGVSVFEAQAYCRWLSAQSGVDVRLPTEAEWDAAARGPNRRPWPWGNVEPARDSINSEALRLGRTSPVGVFPMADTPEGLVDMAGNVWEWTASEYTAQGLLADRVVATCETASMRAVRGGGHHFIPAHCRPDFRFKANPLMRSKAIGFRLASF